MDLNLKGKTALVMGASQGIGKAIAEALISEGVKVALCSRSADKLKKTCEEISADTFFAADLSSDGAGKEVTEKAIAHFGKLDILVTNTGGPDKNNFLEVSSQQWRTDFNSLWLSLTESLQAALPSMQKNQYGRVLMVTSIAAIEPLPGLTTSNGLRAGLSGLARSISNEFAADGITLNLLLPGYTNTDRLKALNLSDEKVKAMVPAGRLGEPCELADLATFLASEKGAYITGQSIAVDGGVLKSH
ncbi:MAG: SDR family oxidoreductase [Halobacteriovoraceae bacterium]|jgi:3-oxoacyl-[acyl-carrier protein] reductase|nr:SDR family oxidoreductase [Halobacteriovoraceae bacterium]MBT5093778.1 SDR family oxidoreductase [Halobacteriovoraceae bacterium]